MRTWYRNLDYLTVLAWIGLVTIGLAATIIRWNLYIVAIAFHLKSSAALCG